VSRVLAKHYRPAPGGPGPSWLSFIGHMTDSLWWTRRLVGVGVHRGAVTGADLCRMFSTPFVAAARRATSAPIMIPVRGAPAEGKPANS
jgi:hypothetical protein